MLLHLLGGCYCGSCTRFIVPNGIFVQVIFLADVAHGLFGGKLLTLFLGIAETGTKLETFYAYAATEGGAVGAYRVLVHKLEHDGKLCLLAPLDELALEVVVLLGHLLEVDMLSYQAMLEEAVAPGIATVEVDGSHQRLKGVAGDEAVVCVVDVSRLYEVDQPRLLGQAVETAALYNLASHRGEEALLLAGKLVVEDVAHYSLYDGIAQILEPLIVFLLITLAVIVERAVHERLTIDRDLARIKSQDTVQLATKLLVAAEEVVYVIGQAVHRGMGFNNKKSYNRVLTN